MPWCCSRLGRLFHLKASYKTYFGRYEDSGSVISRACSMGATDTITQANKAGHFSCGLHYTAQNSLRLPYRRSLGKGFERLPATVRPEQSQAREIWRQPKRVSQTQYKKWRSISFQSLSRSKSERPRKVEEEVLHARVTDRQQECLQTAIQVEQLYIRRAW